MPRGKKKEASSKTPKKSDAPKKRGPGRPKKTATAEAPKETASASAPTTETPTPDAKPKAPRAERRKEPFVPNTERKVVRQLTDTVGTTIHLRSGDPLPEAGGMVHVKTESGQEFDLRISKVQATKKGHTVWAWLRKEAKDGARFRACRLQMATMTY